MADSELTNYKSGVSAIWGTGDGSDKGTAYYEEYLWSDKTQWDAKIVYLRNNTNIDLVLNSIYTGTNGIVRYKLDRDRQKFGQWTRADAGTGTTIRLPAAPSGGFTLASQEYEAGVPVVGTTGHNGGAVTSKTARYYRGAVSAAGNEYHVLQFAIDDRIDAIAAGSDLGLVGAIHAKTIILCVDPKTPCFCPRATGTGQFFTNLAKAYWTPRMVHQTTVFSAGSSGTVTFELRSIYGNEVHYRINGGSWVHAGAGTITLDQDDFSTGSNTLEYYGTSNESYVETRTIIKDPTHPSAAEPHGHFIWGDVSGAGWAKVLERIGRAPYVTEITTWKNRSDFSGTNLDQWLSTTDPARGKAGRRKPGSSTVLKNTFLAKVYGWEWKQTGKPLSTGRYAKEMLLETMLNTDTAGLEYDHSSESVPNRDRHYRGYYDSDPILYAAFAYDIFAGSFRSDQVTDGMTAVEDYFIRDRLASWVYDALIWAMGGTSQAPGMWGGARMMCAQSIAMMMPEYSSPLYGTSGFGSASTTYTQCPFEDVALTWKQALWDTGTTVTDYPNLKYGNITPGSLFVAVPTVKNGVTYPVGSWRDNSGYLSNGQMHKHLMIWANMAARWQGRYDSLFDTAALQIVSDPGIWCIGTSNAPTRVRQTLISLYNAYFADVAQAGLAWSQALPSSSPWDISEVLGQNVFAFGWYEDDWAGGVPTTSAPTFTTQPLSASVTEGDDVSFAAVAVGVPSPAYQWKKNGTNISGATASTLQLTDVQTGDAGSYTCVASNSAGTATSSTATLTVAPVVIVPDPTPSTPDGRSNYRVSGVSFLGL